MFNPQNYKKMEKKEIAKVVVTKICNNIIKLNDVDNKLYNGKQLYYTAVIEDEPVVYFIDKENNEDILIVGIDEYKVNGYMKAVFSIKEIAYATILKKQLI